MSEFCSVNPERFLGGALVPLRGPIQFVAEAQRAAQLTGIRTMSIPTTMVDRPYARPDYEPLWATLQDIGVPVSIHIGTTGESIWDIFQRLGPGPAVTHQKIVTGLNGLADIIWAGVPQRYPTLRFIIAEGGIGWIPSVLTFMDHWWTDHRRWMEPKLAEKPSFYFNRQFWATFEEDRAGVVLAREGFMLITHYLPGCLEEFVEMVVPILQQRGRFRKDYEGTLLREHLRQE